MFAVSLLALAFSAGPTGHYYGTKTVMFNKIKVDMKTVSDGIFSLNVSGAPSGNVDCPTEAYAVNGNSLTLPNLETAGDCAHDQFAAASLTFQSATYDEAADTVTMIAKWKFVTVTVVAKKVAEELEFALAAGPEGHYYGTKTVMFNKIKVDMKTVSPGIFSLNVSGAPSGNVDCPTEAYTLTGNSLSLPNLDTAGDCAHDQFAAASLTFNSATYNPDDDTVTMKAKWKFVSVTVVAKKVAEFEEAESRAPLQRILSKMQN